MLATTHKMQITLPRISFQAEDASRATFKCWRRYWWLVVGVEYGLDENWPVILGVRIEGYSENVDGVWQSRKPLTARQKEKFAALIRERFGFEIAWRIYAE